MAEKAGGRADKFGNAYERLWAIRHALLVLEGYHYSSICWEAFGDDERGVDIWVTCADGIREAHQCKRENGSKGKWTVADLKQVLINAKVQLARSPDRRFVFVSDDPVAYLDELTERTRAGRRPSGLPWRSG